MNFQKHIISYKNNLSTIKAWGKSYYSELSRNPVSILIALLIFLLLALRFRSSSVVGASFLRAFVGRGVWMGIGFALLSLVIFVAIWFVLFLLRPSIANLKTAYNKFYSNVLPAAWAVGFVFNIFFTVALSYKFDEQIRIRAARADHPQGVTFTFPDRSVPLIVRQRADGSYEHRLALQQATDNEQHILEAGEDHRHSDRVIGPDIVRLVHAPFDSTGASGIGEQLAGLLFDLYPSQQTAFFDRLSTKAEKALIGLRIDDIIEDRREQVRLYLELASFGTISGHEVIGLQSAAEIFYGVQPENLAPEQLAELLARVKNPSKLFPYRRLGETDERFNSRLSRLRRRASWFLQQAADKGYLSEAERAQAEGRIFVGLRRDDQVLESVTHPRLFAVYRELRSLVPDCDRRHLAVKVGFDVRTQRALIEAARLGLAEMAPLVGNQGVDQVVIDAVVLGPDGAIRARLGLAEVPDQMASQLKGETYALARSVGVISSMADEVEPGVTAASALAESLNPPAIAVGQKIGLVRLEALLQSEGFQTTGAYPFLPLGAGVSGSPLLVASVFSKFGYSHPGSIVIQPSLISEVRDLDTGAVLFRPQLRPIFTPEVCIDVRSALEQCALTGTAHRLANLAHSGRISAKTGTAAFVGESGHLEGRGGSWVVVNDDLSKTTIAIRVRWQSGRPFAPEGGKSAALVAKHLIPRLRGLN